MIVQGYQGTTELVYYTAYPTSITAAAETKKEPNAKSALL